MLIVFFIEGIILVLVAILVQLPYVKSYKSEHTYKMVEGTFIVIMLVTILLNVFLSNIIGESWGVPKVVPPYDTGVWTAIIFSVIYLFCFRDFNLGGIVVTKTVKWTQLNDRKLLDLYPAFIMLMNETEFVTKVDSSIFVDQCISRFQDYGKVSVLRLESSNLKYSFKFGELTYYSDNKDICEMMDCLNVVMGLKGRA